MFFGKKLGFAVFFGQFILVASVLIVNFLGLVNLTARQTVVYSPKGSESRAMAAEDDFQPSPRGNQTGSQRHQLLDDGFYPAVFGKGESLSRYRESDQRQTRVRCVKILLGTLYDKSLHISPPK